MSVIHHPGYFTSLPRDYYTDPAVFDEEIERVFERQWLYVGHVCQLPEPGDFMVVRAATESLIVLRDRDERVRAYFNVCRHRGSRLCPQGTSGRTKQLVCPYHRWSWSLDGGLLGAPGSPNGLDFDYADFPLHEAACDTFQGSIYVHLGVDPDQTLRESIGEKVNEHDLGLLEPERVKLVHEKRYTIAANWKLALENNAECYHCAGSHPELSVSCDPRGFFVERDGVVRDEERRRNPGHFPLREGMKTFSMDGDWVCRRLLGTPQAPGFSASYVRTPMYTAIGYWADHAVHLALNPVDVDTTELLAQWFVHEDAVEGVDYDVDAVIGVFDATNREDVELIEANQLGVRSRRFVPGPNSPTRETLIEHALERYLQLMEG